jgi:hypothetical protein
MANLSFELLHLIAALLGRFNFILEECKLNVQQLYLLAYYGSHGTSNRQGQKILLRADITKILKEVFKCSDTQVSDWVTELCAKKYLGEITLSKDERAELFLTRKGRVKALVITNKGMAKVTFFVKRLEKLRDEVTRPDTKLLLPPGVTSGGIVAIGLQEFVNHFHTELQAKQ